MFSVDMPSQPPTSFLHGADDTVVSRIYGHFSGKGSSTEMRLLLIVGLVIFVHVAVKILRHSSEWIILKRKSHQKNHPLIFRTRQPKFITISRLVVSAIIFILYFFAFGLILQEIGVNLTAYLAGASIIGLAISFGSQGLVQDIVSGMTLIFCDAMDVGDLVEIASINTIVIGRVEEIGLRFTTLVNFLHQKVLIPNRNIGTVSRFPPGGVDAYGNVKIPAGVDPQKVVQIVGDEAKGMWEQFDNFKRADDWGSGKGAGRRLVLFPRPLQNPARTGRVDRKDFSPAGGQRHESFRSELRRMAGARDVSCVNG